MSPRAWFIVALVACSAFVLLPLWSVDLLPMADLPQHAAQVATWRAIDAGDVRYQSLYWVNYATPYLLGYSIARAFATFLPIATALKVVVSLSLLAALVATTSLVARQGGQRIWGLAVAPLLFTMSFYWGFLNYLVALPLAIVFVLYAFEYQRTPSLPRAFGLFALAALLYLAHGLTMIYGCASGFAIALSTQRPWRARIVSTWPFVLPVLAMAIWFVSVRAADDFAREPIVWKLGFMRLLHYAYEVLGVSAGMSVVQVGCALVLLAVPALFGAKLSFSDGRAWPILVASAMFFTLPFKGFGTSCLYPRFGVFVAPMLIAMFRARQNEPARVRYLPMVLVAAVAVSLVTLSQRFWEFDDEASDFRPVLAKMDPGKRAIGLVFQPLSRAVAAPAYDLFPSWYQAEKSGVVDPSFATRYQTLVRYRVPAKGITPEFHAQDFRWENNADYDYFLVRAQPELAARVFAGRGELVAQQGTWWLFRRK